MVFENVTLFRIQLDDAPFGRRSINDDDADEAEAAAEESSGRARLLPVALFVIMAASAGWYYRRSRSADLALDDESETADADSATAQ